MSLAENIYKFRTQQNMSQLDLADTLEVSRQSVSKWETGSAVPELEKLMKMSDLFGVTLDELVGRKIPEPAAPTPPETAVTAEPKIIYIEKPAFPTIGRNQMIGAVILLCAILYALILYNGRFGLEETFFMVLPVAACGAVYLLTAHPLFYSGWIAAGAYWGHFFILFHRWEEHSLLILLGVVLPAAMALWTVRIRRSGKINIPVWVMVVGGIVLILLLILLCMNCMPLAEGFVTEQSAVPSAQ